MVRRYRSRVSLGITIAAVLFTAMCLLLPEVRTPQTIVREGPSSPYGASDYTFTGYVIPPVPAGSQIIVAIQGYLPKSLTFSLFPAAAGDLNPTGPALLVMSNFTGAPFLVSVTAPASESYAIFITSLNRTGFAIGIRGTWSLFYVLRVYVIEGVFASIAAAVATYYFRWVEGRQAVEEAAIREVKSQRAAERTLRLPSAHSWAKSTSMTMSAPTSS
jgi:hypothetical protein